MVGEGVVFQGMRGYRVPPHAPAVACFTMSVTQHIWLKKKYYRVPIFNPVVSEATRLSSYRVVGSAGCCLLYPGPWESSGERLAHQLEVSVRHSALPKRQKHLPKSCTYIHVYIYVYDRLTYIHICIHIYIYIHTYVFRCR